MIRRAYIIGIVAAGLAMAAAQGSPAYGKFVSSAHNFERYFHALKTSGSLANPVERFLFSLILANAKPSHTESQAQKIEIAPPSRT